MNATIYYSTFCSLDDSEEMFEAGKNFSKHGFHDIDSLEDVTDWFGYGHFGTLDILIGIKSAEEVDAEEDLTAFFVEAEEEELEAALTNGIEINGVKYTFIDVKK